MHNTSRTYKPTPTYAIGALILTAAAVWLGVQFWREPEILLGIFFAGVAIVALSMLTGLFARVEFDGQTLTYRSILRSGHRIDLTQIDSVSLEGRRTRALVIMYHPLDKEKRIDVERLKFINMPPLQNQEDLYERLMEALGHDDARA
ncbi:MAG: hypothetical protein GXP42_16905 [Chloroflexi bacterium]|nr:hypothetical protein [Chloroflexota bacterium]